MTMKKTKTPVTFKYTSHTISAKYPDGTIRAACGLHFEPVSDCEAAEVFEGEWQSCPLCEAADIIDDLEYHWEQGELL